MLQGGATGITANSAAIKTTPGPLSIYALKNFASNTIQFAHAIVVIIAVVIIFQVQITWTIALVAIGIASSPSSPSTASTASPSAFGSAPCAPDTETLANS